MDAIPQVGSSQVQSLAALFSSSPTPGAKDSKAFGKELTKQIDGSGSATQTMGKPHKEKRDKDVPDQSDCPATDLPLVVPTMIPMLNLTQENAITVVPFTETVSPIKSTVLAAPMPKREIVAVADDPKADVLPILRSSSSMGPTLTAASCDVTDVIGSTGSIQEPQEADPRQLEQVDAANGDHRDSRTAKSESDSEASGIPIQTPQAGSAADNTGSTGVPFQMPAAGSAIADPQVAANADCNAIAKPTSSQTLGESHHDQKQAATAECDKSQAAPPSKPAKLSTSTDTVAQLMPPAPMVMDGAAVNATAKAIEASAPGSVLPMQAKENAAKPALPVENQKAVKDSKSNSGDPKTRVGQRDASAPLQAGTQPAHEQQPDHEQMKAGASKVNAEKTPDILPAMHSASSVPSVPLKEDARLGQSQEAVQISSPDLALPKTSPADVVHAVRMFERDGQAEMHIGVRSETLGTIDVKATVHNGNVGVSIGVERHEIRSALVSELPGLENTLRERDLRLGEVKFHDMGSALASEYGNGQRRQAQEFSRPFVSSFYRDMTRTAETNELPLEMVTTIAPGGISVHV